MSDGNNTQYDIWIGAYAAKEQVGITRLKLDGETGALTKEAEFTGMDNPSFLAMDSAGRYLHAVSEVAETNGEPCGEVVTFEVRDGGASLHEAVSHSTLGAHPCFLMLDPREQWLAVSNYSGASAVVYPLEPSGIPGPLHVRFRHSGTGPNPERQEAPHPHAAVFGADGQFLYVPDLGLDKILIYSLNRERQEWVGYDAASVAPGAGPRHFKFHPSGKAAYVVNELDSTVTRFTCEEPGSLTKQESLSTLPSSFEGTSHCAEIAVSPDGRFVYASNRGHDSLAIFAIDEATGALCSAGFVSTRGRTPRHFAIAPDGRWLIAANQESDSVVLFRVDESSGLPVYTGTELTVGKPVCVYIRRRF